MTLHTGHWTAFTILAIFLKLKAYTLFRSRSPKMVKEVKLVKEVNIASWATKKKKKLMSGKP